MIAILAKYGAAVLTGVCAGLLVYRITYLLAARIKPRSPGRNYRKAALLLLEENPGSKESVKIRLLLSAITAAVFQLLTGKFLFALLFAAGTFFGIAFFYKKRIRNRMEVFENQLIEALGMITNSVRAGQSLQQALENMAKDTKPPVSTEFTTALRQVKLGVPLDRSLLELSERIKSKDLNIAVTSINLAKETGGNLGEILSRLVSTMKERRKIQGKIIALTAQGKVSGIVMGCVPFFLLAVLYVIEPNMMGLLFSTLLGNVMLFMAVVMVALGMFFIQKIVNIDI